MGDVGSFESGVLVVRPGRPDAIVTAGATVLIADVEAVLAPAARGSVTVLRAASDLGSGRRCPLTLGADREPLERLVRDRLPVTHRPRVWRVVPHLPLTDGGKVDRAALAR